MTRTIEVNEETYEKIKDQLAQSEVKDINDYKDFIGEKFFFRTVTFHMIGRVDKIVGKFLCLTGASWIADSGRFMQAIKDGELNEVEPVGKAYVNLDSIVDFFPWVHALPDKQK